VTKAATSSKTDPQVTKMSASRSALNNDLLPFTSYGSLATTVKSTLKSKPIARTTSDRELTVIITENRNDHPSSMGAAAECIGQSVASFVES
jgi:hypothetical protein